MDQVIPLSSSPNQSFAVPLIVDGQPLTLQLTLRWSSMAGYWVMTVSDSAGNLLADSIPLITGWYPAGNLLAQQSYLKIGSAYVINNGESQQDYPGQNNLGTSFSLLWSDTPDPTLDPASIAHVQTLIIQTQLAEIKFSEAETPQDSGDHQHFTLLYSPDPPGGLLLTVNGLVQAQPDDYSVDGNALIFSSPLATPFSMRAWYTY